MSPQVKKFIEENIEYINRAEFKLLYISLNAMWNSFSSTAETSRQISEFTEVMLNAGIDPLDYLEWIPECYLYKSNTYIKNLSSNKKLNDIAANAFYLNSVLETVNVNTEYVSRNAFCSCANLRSVRLQSTIDIELDAFGSCSALTEVELPKTLQHISIFAFDDCDNLKSIEFKGTVKDWLNVKLESNWAGRSYELGTSVIEIKCIDGIYNQMIL